MYCCTTWPSSVVSLSGVSTEESIRIRQPVILRSTGTYESFLGCEAGAQTFLRSLLYFSQPMFQLCVSFCQLRISEANTCKVRYIAKHLSEVKIDASPVNKEWVECPVGARLELLANPSEVSPNSSRSKYRPAISCHLYAMMVLYIASSTIPNPLAFVNLPPRRT